MIIKKIAFGNDQEAFIEDRLTNGFNIIYSDDNNKGKTIVMQSGLYAIGNTPIFPSSFNYKDYYHYVEIQNDNGETLISCRRGNSFIVKTEKSISILDSIAELKRFLNKNGIIFPVIIKDNIAKMVDPVLLYQIFFVGQDNKNSASIFNDSYYKKGDFWALIFALGGLGTGLPDVIDSEEIHRKIALLKNEKELLLTQHKILKSSNPSVAFISQKKGNDAFLEKLKKIDTLKDAIVEFTNRRNRALSRKTINEKTLMEIRSLNRTPNSGNLYCLDCGSGKIGYASGDKSYTFDISDKEMRSNIIISIEEKINSYQEEIEQCTIHLNQLQQQLQELLKENEIDLETVLLLKDKIVDAAYADTRIVEIDNEIKSLNTKLKIDKQKEQTNFEKRKQLKNTIIDYMNYFYHKVDPAGTLYFDDLFSKRNSVYSGCEETEFYLAKLYALAYALHHKYPIMMDYFRDGELSSIKEDTVLTLFSELKNQIIFTATLKEEELDKYNNYSGIHAINYSANAASHILSSSYSNDFRKLLKSLMLIL